MPQFVLSVEGMDTYLGDMEFATQLYQVKHDYELPLGIRDCAPCPEVFRLEPHTGVLLTEELQYFWYNLLVKMNNGYMSNDSLKSAWRNLTASNRAFTNGRGTDTCRDFISNTNYGQVLPMFYPLVCGGNILTGDEVIVNNISWLRVNTIDTTDLVGISREETPWLIQFGTIVQFDKVIRFPQLDGKEVPVPVLGKQPIYFPMWKLKKLPLGSPIPPHLIF